MFKKIKLPALLIIISIYMIGIVLTFSGDLFIQIQHIRQNQQIKRVHDISEHVFSIAEWNSFSDKKEINYKNNYYDVISYQYVGHKIIVKMVRDNFENELRVVYSQIFKTKKIPEPQKKKTVRIAFHFCKKNNYKTHFYDYFLKKIINNYSSYFQLKTNSFIDFELKPPRI